MSVFESQTEHELKPILARCKVQSVRVVYVGHLLNECAECTLESQHETRSTRTSDREAKHGLSVCTLFGRPFNPFSSLVARTIPMTPLL